MVAVIHSSHLGVWSWREPGLMEALQLLLVLLLRKSALELWVIPCPVLALWKCCRKWNYYHGLALLRGLWLFCHSFQGIGALAAIPLSQCQLWLLHSSPCSSSRATHTWFCALLCRAGAAWGYSLCFLDNGVPCVCKCFLTLEQGKFILL